METHLQPGAIAYAIYNPQYDGGFGFYIKEIRVCACQYESPENETPPPAGMVWVKMNANKDEANNARQLIHENGIFETKDEAIDKINRLKADLLRYNKRAYLTEPRKLLKSDSRIEFRENPLSTGGKLALEMRFDRRVNRTALYIHSSTAKYPEFLTEFAGESKNDLTFVKEAIRGLKEYEKKLKGNIK